MDADVRFPQKRNILRPLRRARANHVPSPGQAALQHSRPLRSKQSLTIGYGDGDTDLFELYIPDGQNVDVSFRTQTHLLDRVSQS